MTQITISYETLILIVGILISLAFEKFPAMKVWFDGVDRIYKPLIMALLSVIASLIIFSMACFYPIVFAFKPELVCSTASAADMIIYSFVAFGGNQAFFAILKALGLDNPVKLLAKELESK